MLSTEIKDVFRPKDKKFFLIVIHMAYQIDKNKIAKNTVALYIRMGITMVISFIAARVTLQVLGVDDYGLNNLVGSVVAMFSFINGSMGAAVQRFYSIEIGRKDDAKLKRVFSSGLYCHIIVALITLLLTEIFAVFFLHKLNIPSDRMMAAQVVFQISIFQMILNIVSVPYSALLRARERFSSTAVIDIIQAVLRLGVLYLLYIIDFDKLILLAGLNLAITVFFVGAYVVLALQHTESHVGPSKDIEIIREMLKFISLLIITVIMQVLRDKGIVLLINIFFGLAINAAYAVAMQVSNLVNTFVMNFKSSIVPQMVSSYGAGDKRSMFRLITIGTKITFVLLLMISLPFATEAEYILALWLKSPPENSSMLVILVMVNINIASFTYLLYQAIHATGNITFQQIWTSVIFALNVWGIFMAFKLGASFEYALYVTIASSLLQACLNIYCASHFLGYKALAFLKENVIPALFVTVISIAIVTVVQKQMQESFLRLMIVLMLSVIIVFCTSALIMFNKSERQIISSYIKTILISRKSRKQK